MQQRISGNSFISFSPCQIPHSFSKLIWSVLCVLTTFRCMTLFFCYTEKTIYKHICKYRVNGRTVDLGISFTLLLSCPNVCCEVEVLHKYSRKQMKTPVRWMPAFFFAWHQIKWAWKYDCNGMYYAVISSKIQEFPGCINPGEVSSLEQRTA